MTRLALLLLLTGCTRQTLRCLLLAAQTCPDYTNGGASSFSAPLPPKPPDPCTADSSVTNNQCNPNPLALATTCDPTDADGDPYDDDCPTPDPNHP